jgi:SAM-dependent methyltransferase
MPKLTPAAIKSQFSEEACVSHYVDATVNIGLWQAEENVLGKNFKTKDTLLEIGCGAGRISLGLWELGYHQVIGTDLARPMVAAARELARKLEYAVPFRVADATSLPFEDNLFDGAIFGFNGLMQIPGRALRVTALNEIRRVVRPGGIFVLTTHDRAFGGKSGFWEEEERRWGSNQQDERLLEFGDLLTSSSHGEIYIHIPTREEMLVDLAEAGWRVLDDRMRSSIAEESEEVQQFSVDCRFWVVVNSDEPREAGAD